MARVFITGSVDGLGRTAAQTLLDEGHEVVVHGRSHERLSAVRDLLDRGASSVVGDLSDPSQVRDVAAQVNDLGRMDAIIHNAGVNSGSAIWQVNVVAPYVLTALIERPSRLVYLSSEAHLRGSERVEDLNYSSGSPIVSYDDSKLFVTTLAFAIARVWPDVLSNAVHPGWVPTKMGGPDAPDDLSVGHVTQVWLSTSDDPDALTSGSYWHHQQRVNSHKAVSDERFQDELLRRLAIMTDVVLD